jgi:hypothetical protein
MAERIKDAEDRLLDSLFASSPVADDGFSVAVVAKVKRRLWLRRLALPAAAVIGGSIAVKPLAGLVIAAKNISSLIPESLLNTTVQAIPPLQTIILGAMLLAACLLGARTLQE